jgi:hypothetical protein
MGWRCGQNAKGRAYRMRWAGLLAVTSLVMLLSLPQSVDLLYVSA